MYKNSPRYLESQTFDDMEECDNHLAREMRKNNDTYENEYTLLKNIDVNNEQTTLFVYLGKIIYWLWCQTQSECPENHFPQGKYENCECHYRISVYNYWYNFQNFLGEIILGGLGTALLIILFSCCFSQTRPQIRN